MIETEDEKWWPNQGIWYFPEYAVQDFAETKNNELETSPSFVYAGPK